MKINSIIVGLYECNCYILEQDNKLLIVDPGDDYHKIKKMIANKEVVGVLITHSHPDHVGALHYFSNPIYSFNNLKEEKYSIGPFSFEVIFTPGHTNDSITYYFSKDNLMFTGDFLFKGTIGRCDLPTGNVNVMYNSLDKIKKYSDNITIYPGHGEKSTLGQEKRYNEYLK